ncbi:MAG: hypothetical protein IJZ84_02890 [Lachnospiraceae bacterium]|nr:hypothetical protein [Lachnospiraceae bacterium]
MTAKEIEILDRINKYAEEKLGDIDPQKTQVSAQLNILMPKLQEIADELGISLEDMFIKYMDLQSEASLTNELKLRESFSDLANDPGNPLLFR